MGFPGTGHESMEIRLFSLHLTCWPSAGTDQSYWSTSTCAGDAFVCWKVDRESTKVHFPQNQKDWSKLMDTGNLEDF